MKDVDSMTTDEIMTYNWNRIALLDRSLKNSKNAEERTMRIHCQNGAATSLNNPEELKRWVDFVKTTLTQDVIKSVELFMKKQ